MTIYVIVGENKGVENISARAAFTKREDAEKYDAWEVRS